MKEDLVEKIYNRDSKFFFDVNLIVLLSINFDSACVIVHNMIIQIYVIRQCEKNVIYLLLTDYRWVYIRL